MLVYYNLKSCILSFNKTFLGGTFIQLYPSFDFAGVKSVVNTLDLIIYQVTKSKFKYDKIKIITIASTPNQHTFFNTFIKFLIYIHSVNNSIHIVCVQVFINKFILIT